MAVSALAGQSGFDMEGYRDYRGAPVVGAWLRDKEHGFGLAFEVDVAEAYQSYYDVRKVVLLTLGVIVFLFLIFTAGLWKGRSRVLKLAERTRVANRKLKRSRGLLESINHAQSRFIAERPVNRLFDDLLDDLLALTESECGFISDIIVFGFFSTVFRDENLQSGMVIDVSARFRLHQDQQETQVELSCKSKRFKIMWC